MKKVLITGGEGVLAHYFKSTFHRFSILAPGHKSLDITDPIAIDSYFSKNRPNIVIHLAAKIDVDGCEKNPEEAFLINAQGTKNIALACKKYNCFLVYVSTAAVFRGDKKGYTEEDIPDPVNIYGKSKLAGEKYIQEILSNYLIVRAAWLIGGGKKEKKFVSYILQQLEVDDVIKAVNDKIGTISYGKELADFTLDLLSNAKRGIYHFGSRGVCTRFEIAQRIVKIIKKNKIVIPVTSRHFTSTFFAPRPNFEILKSKYVRFPYTWKKSLKNYIEKELLS